MNTFGRLALILGLTIFTVGCGSGSSSGTQRGPSGGDNSGFSDDADPFFNQGDSGAGADGALPIDCSLVCVIPVIGQTLADQCVALNGGDAVTCPATPAPVNVDCTQALNIPVIGAQLCASCVTGGGQGDCSGPAPAPALPVAGPTSLQVQQRAVAAAPLGSVNDLSGAAEVMIAELNGQGETFLREAVANALTTLRAEGELSIENVRAAIQSVVDSLSYFGKHDVSADDADVLAAIRTILVGLIAGLDGDETARTEALTALKPQLESLFEQVNNGEGDPLSLSELLESLPVSSSQGNE